MKILSFFPLLLWAISLFWIEAYETIGKLKAGMKWDDVKKEQEDSGDAFSKVWLWGCIIWLVIGVLCSTNLK